MSEIFYRAIKRSRPDTIGTDGKPTPALFKDARGVSMDKKDGRSETDVCELLKKHLSGRLKGIVSLMEEPINEAEAYVSPAPSRDNEYHIELYKNTELDPIDNLQALQLSDACKLVVLEDKPEWVQKG